MKKQTKLVRSQKGQSIVLIAVVMVGMLALAGLAIDGGNLFLQRRRAQNAADAGALAGTRVLALIIAACEDGDSADDAQVAQAVTEFIAGNGFSEASGSTIVAWYVDANSQQLAQVGGGAIPQSATGVEVHLDAAIPTYFMQVVGINNSTFGAEAMAMTGKVVQFSGGVLPIAVPLEVVENLEPETPMVIIDTHSNGMVCKDTNGNGRYDSGSDICIGDPGNQNSHRGWLNLNYIYNTEHLARSDPFYRTFEQNVPNRGCGPDPNISTDDGVRGWCGDGCPYPYPIFSGSVGAVNGDFIHGSPGARQSSLAEVIETYNGEIVYVPVFDYIYMSDYMATYFPQPEGIGWPRAGGGGQAFLYHIVGFTAVRVDDPNAHDHTLAGAFQEAIIGDGMIHPSAGLGLGACQESLLYGVNLWR
jgi:hypothetical protein